MGTSSFRYETSQTLQAALSDGELAALRGLLRRARMTFARLAAMLGLRAG